MTAEQRTKFNEMTVEYREVLDIIFGKTNIDCIFKMEKSIENFWAASFVRIIKAKSFFEHRFPNGFPNEIAPEITQISGAFNMSEKRSFSEQYSGFQTYNIFLLPCSSLSGQLYII